MRKDADYVCTIIHQMKINPVFLEISLSMKVILNTLKMQKNMKLKHHVF